MLRAELKRIDHQLHRWLDGINPFFLSNVFLENIVLQSSGHFLPVGALLLRHNQIHRQQNRRRRVDRLGNCYLLKRDLVEQDFHVGER